MKSSLFSFAALWLDKITMYRLMLYFMIVLLGAAAILSALGRLPYSAAGIILQSIVFAGICWAVNTLIARLLKIQPNVESSLITGLILAAIVGPLSLPRDLLVLLVAASAAIGSKYVFVIRRSHVFNPAAFGAVAAALVAGNAASWWIGDLRMLLPILLGGLIMTRKLRRFHVVLAFLGVYGGLVFGSSLLGGGSFTQAGRVAQSIMTSPLLLFFCFVMLVEPLTAPRTVRKRVIFGAFVAVAFFALQRLAASVPYFLELSLLVGNAFARIIDPDFRQAFRLKRREVFSPTITNFWFDPNRRFAFLPGQFLEYTLGHARSDARGVRRYFTIASSPTEAQVLLTSRFSEPGSTFKQTLKEMKEGSEIVASKVAGEFTMPSDIQKKLAFLAGGIGVTPFRSMVKYLLDAKQSRDIVLLYGARGEDDLVFRDLFEQARQKLGMRTVYVLGRPIDETTIRQEIPDFRERTFYLSGPEAMVESLRRLLIGLGVSRWQIKRDYFPGYGAP